MRTRHSSLRLDRRRTSIPVLPVLLLLSLGANVFFFLRWAPPASEGRLTEAVESLAGSSGEPAATDVPPVAPAEIVPAPVAVVAPVIVGGPKLVRGAIDGPVARAFTDKLGDAEGSRVAVTAARLFSWWLDVTSDARKGDSSAVLYELSTENDAEVIVHAANYVSQKMGRTFEAFRFRPDGWAFAGWFDATGKEVPARLVLSPIDEYDQITSLVGDGRGHSGMDFKAPIGTEVHAPWDGQVIRVNWNVRFNGDCVELSARGKKVRFLHLSQLGPGIKAGATIKAGQVLGLSGNTGRSFAPHLHYEIEDANGRTRDPLKEHETTRRSLPEGSKMAFDAEVTRLRAALAAEVPAALTPPAAPAPVAPAPAVAPL